MEQELEVTGAGISDEQMMRLREAVRAHVVGRLMRLDQDMDDLVEEVRMEDPKRIPAALRMKLAVLTQLADVAGLRGFRAPPKLPEPEPDPEELARIAERERAEREAAAAAVEAEAERRAALVAAARARVVQELGG